MFQNLGALAPITKMPGKSCGRVSVGSVGAVVHRVRVQHIVYKCGGIIGFVFVYIDLSVRGFCVSMYR